MIANFPFYLGAIIVIIILTMLADKIKVAYPILLVVAGLGISLVPGVPVIKIEHELIFVIFLPPLLYEASWAISWKELWRWRRIITSFAFVVVFLTALSVAFIANAFIPGFSLALGFLLGGIVSPPDAVSIGAILKFVKVPKRMSSILEGESLLNDASSLIILRFSMIAVATGQFIWYEAALSFSWMVIGGLGIGLLVGYLFMKVHKYLPTDVNMDIALTIVTPYVMYIIAEELHSSGILAVVSGGLLLSNERHYFLNSTSRLRSVNVWESFIFILNGIVFLLIGLDLQEIITGLQGISLSSAIGYGMLITVVIILVRILSSYGALLVTLVMKNFIPVANSRSPGLKAPFIMGWSGMRGVVSLAAALSIPLNLNDGSEFPQRNLILFITFTVILLTLVIQGLTLPLILKKVKLPLVHDHLPDGEANETLKSDLALHITNLLNEKYKREIVENKVLEQYLDRKHFQIGGNSEIKNLEPIFTDLLNQQRNWLLNVNKNDSRFSEEIIRKNLMIIDLEEEKLRNM